MKKKKEDVNSSKFNTMWIKLNMSEDVMLKTVTFNQAKLFKKMGFNNKISAYYSANGTLNHGDNFDYNSSTNEFSAPNLNEVERWSNEFLQKLLNGVIPVNSDKTKSIMSAFRELCDENN